MRIDPRRRLQTSSRAALVIVALMVTGCKPRQSGDAVRVGIDVDAETLDPRLMRNTTAYRVVNLLYDGLVQLDTALTPLPDLAERWEHPDPRTWIFHLRAGVRFHDGTPLTADDVVYTFRSVLDPATGAPLRALYTPIERVDATGDDVVRFTLSHPDAPLLRYLDLGVVPRSRRPMGTHDVGVLPGTGPYMLERWEKGSRIVLRANPHYWAGPPAVQHIELVLVPDNTARAQSFEAGDLDLIQSPLSPQDTRRLTADRRFLHATLPGLAITYLDFNTDRPILRDAATRRALAMLVDQQTILQRIYEKTELPATSVLLPTWSAYAEAIRQPRFDTAAARRQLLDAGWRDTDGDGILDRAGAPLALRLATHAEDVNRVQTIEFLQNAFAPAGVKATVDVSDWPSFSAKRDAGDFDIILLGWTQLVDPDRLLFDQLHSGGGLNWGGYHNPRVDQLLEQGRMADDEAQRVHAYREVARIIARDCPWYVIAYQQYQVFLDPALQGFVPDARGMLRGLLRVTRPN